MNCKPGDLALIVRVNQRRFEPILGFIISVTTLRANYRTGKPCWNFEGSLPCTTPGDYVTGVDDDELVPIRPHGDDEADESRAWLHPVPTREKVLA